MTVLRVLLSVLVDYSDYSEQVSVRSFLLFENLNITSSISLLPGKNQFLDSYVGRGVHSIPSNIYNGAFLPNLLAMFSIKLF